MKRTHDWQVTFDIITSPFDDHALDVVLDTLADRGGSLGVAGDDTAGQLSITLTVEAMQPDVAFKRGDDTVHRALEKAGIDIRRTIAFEVVDEVEADRRLAVPTIPPLVGAAEAGELLGTSRQRIHQLHREHSQFPVPVVQVRLGPLWTRASVEAFAETWERRPGRPAKRSA